MATRRHHHDHGTNQSTLPSRGAAARSSRKPFSSTTWITILLFSCCLSFYAGVYAALGASKSSSPATPDCGKELLRLQQQQQQQPSSRELKTTTAKEASTNNCDYEEVCAQVCLTALIGGKGPLATKLDGKLDSILQSKIDIALETDCPKTTNANSLQGGGKHYDATTKAKAKAKTNRFPKSTSHYAAGLVSVNRQAVFDAYDFGVPMDSNAAEEDVLLLYNSRKALPSGDVAREAIGGGDIPRMENAEEATRNCDAMNVMFVKKGELDQCVAIVGGQYQGQHLQRWMRVVGEQAHGKFDHNAPLVLKGRYTKGSGYDEMLYPKQQHVNMHNDFMTKYLTNLDKIRRDLGAILKEIAIDNTVIVTTVNEGQSELLTNFVCSSRARGFKQKNLIVFPTDEFSKELSEGMGVATYFAEELMGDIPSKEAARYGDQTFGLIMMAKVICVQLVSDLGYNILFQDVDVIWMQDPLPFFDSDEAMANFDIYFQDDGNRQERFAPFSANSGFYYIRNNMRTKMLFRTMLHSGDLIFSTRSHQQILVALLAEANSLTGLRVKVLSRDREELPSGYHYHMDKDFMRKFVKGDTNSYIFHMCWTLNKDDKLKFLQQMGMWYVNDQCVGKTTSEILPGKYAGVVDACCSAEPLFTCHYSDKASIKSCRDSPPKDKGQRSFW